MKYSIDKSIMKILQQHYNNGVITQKQFIKGIKDLLKH